MWPQIIYKNFSYFKAVENNKPHTSFIWKATRKIKLSYISSLYTLHVFQIWVSLVKLFSGTDHGHLSQNESGFIPPPNWANKFLKHLDMFFCILKLLCSFSDLGWKIKTLYFSGEPHQLRLLHQGHNVAYELLIQYQSHLKYYFCHHIIFIHNLIHWCSKATHVFRTFWFYIP